MFYEYDRETQRFTGVKYANLSKDDIVFMTNRNSWAVETDIDIIEKEQYDEDYELGIKTLISRTYKKVPSDLLLKAERTRPLFIGLSLMNKRISVTLDILALKYPYNLTYLDSKYSLDRVNKDIVQFVSDVNEDNFDDFQSYIKTSFNQNGLTLNSYDDSLAYEMIIENMIYAYISDYGRKVIKEIEIAQKENRAFRLPEFKLSEYIG